jgi:hypothetical protein
MSYSEFNDTLFQLMDEMMGIVDASPVLKTAYAVFKGTNTDSSVALDAFWDVAKDNAELVHTSDLKAMSGVLRDIVPLPGMVDDVWEKLSEDNREIVGEYISALFEIAAKVKATEGTSESEAVTKEGKDATLYSMYNSMWKDFLVLLQKFTPVLSEAVEKINAAMSKKGPSTTMVYAVMWPAMELVLPRQQFESEKDILMLCLPPSNAAGLVRKDLKKMEGALFPFDRKVPFSEILEGVLQLDDKALQERLSTYWHYIKLFTVCLKECPPEAMGMMNTMVKFVQGSLS